MVERPDNLNEMDMNYMERIASAAISSKTKYASYNHHANESWSSTFTPEAVLTLCQAALKARTLEQKVHDLEEEMYGSEDKPLESYSNPAAMGTNLAQDLLDKHISINNVVGFNSEVFFREAGETIEEAFKPVFQRLFRAEQKVRELEDELQRGVNQAVVESTIRGEITRKDVLGRDIGLSPGFIEEAASTELLERVKAEGWFQ